jgi:cyanophycinase
MKTLLYFQTFLILCFVFFCYGQQGYLVLNGGGEKPRSIMEEFVHLSGGRNKLISVITTASGDPTTPEYYMKLFKETYRCTDVVHLNITRREHSSHPENVRLIQRSGGVWFSGGDQNRLHDIILGTPVGNEIKKSHFERKLTVGGKLNFLNQLSLRYICRNCFSK